jgi:protein ImuA
MTVHVASPDRIADLRARIAAVAASTTDHGVLPFGIESLDDRLAAGGLSGGWLHEVSGASTSLADDAAATLFVAGIAARFAIAAAAPVLWATTRFDLYAPGLEQAGLAPANVIFAEPRDDDQLLAVLEDAVRDGSPAAVIGEVRRASMTATRRLQLAAGEAGVPVLLFRRWHRAGREPLSEPSAAATRWRIACAPSGPLRVAGVGRARWRVDLVRQRGGEPFSLTLEGCDATGRLAVPAAARRRAAPAAGTAQYLAA